MSNKEMTHNGRNEETRIRPIEQSVSGDAAYEALFHRFYNDLLMFGCTLTDRRHVVEDQIQELFIWLYRNPDGYRHVKNMESYLFVSLKRNIVKALKKDTTQRIRLNGYVETQEDVSRSAEANWVEEDDQRQRTRQLQTRVAQLPPRMREVIFLRYYRCMPYDEIAVVMSVSSQVARNFAFRALKKVRVSYREIESLL